MILSQLIFVSQQVNLSDPSMGMGWTPAWAACEACHAVNPGAQLWGVLEMGISMDKVRWSGASA